MSRNFELLKQLENAGDRISTTPTPNDIPMMRQIAPPAAGELLSQLETELNVGNVSEAHADVALAQQPSAREAIDLFGEETVQLVQTVFLSNDRRAARQVVFCGVDGENGSSSVCQNAGRALMAISGRSVCLVDGNLISQRLFTNCATNKPVLISNSSSSVREQCIRIDDNLWLAGMDLLVDGSGALLSVAELKYRFLQLGTAFDYILVDAPGVGVSRDAALLGEAAGAAILVVEANITRRLTARRAKDSLEAAGVRLLGTVLRNRSFPIPQSLLNRL